ncbi:hypothetical protein F2P81_013430 [Scophthalmus maximus]|uniref:Uncharacterized protein n=1 Tax=Scophthalmus maximus TaxID=52904 RepID=A0A6A4SQS0_SCOMX|nr:hypothetical protein F2P81_013430 [Scophthalmus maximus]
MSSRGAGGATACCHEADFGEKCITVGFYTDHPLESEHNDSMGECQPARHPHVNQLVILMSTSSSSSCQPARHPHVNQLVILMSTSSSSSCQSARHPHVNQLFILMSTSSSSSCQETISQICI